MGNIITELWRAGFRVFQRDDGTSKVWIDTVRSEALKASKLYLGADGEEVEFDASGAPVLVAGGLIYHRVYITETANTTGVYEYTQDITIPEGYSIEFLHSSCILVAQFTSDDDSSLAIGDATDPDRFIHDVSLNSSEPGELFFPDASFIDYAYPDGGVLTITLTTSGEVVTPAGSLILSLALVKTANITTATKAEVEVEE